MGRLLVAANRLPVSATVERGELVVRPSSGGLATALGSLPKGLSTRWIGWPGDVAVATDEQRSELEARLDALSTVPVYLTKDDVDRYYDGFSNGVLWPLLHYLVDKVRLDAWREWASYREVNERFAKAIVARYVPGDLVWVHDYQLALVPELVRRALPDARIGFFLHVPFPSEEVFRIVPWRAEILRGILGADVVGFHTSSYCQNFVASAAHVLGVDPGVDSLEWEERTVRIGAFPISIDARSFAATASEPAVRAEADQMRASAHAQSLVLGVDRLDYTKGILRRILAIEHFLETHPDRNGTVRFIQLAVPTREGVAAYADYKRTVVELVGRVNSRFGSVQHVPLHFLERSVSRENLAALYLAADVMLVTPLRDGMNLVAKEYVASRVNDDGALILSEFAGAAAELSQALIVNPNDIQGVAAAIHQALEMTRAEQRVRMQSLRKTVFEHDVARWARTFVAALGRPAQASTRPPPVASLTAAPSDAVLERARHAANLVVLLDYDGTLVRLATTPDLATPDDELLALLDRMAARPSTEVHVVSGRPRDALEQWLGSLRVGLHAEHGYWSRARPGEPWLALRPLDLAWKDVVRPVLEDVTERTVGAFVEEKTTALAWHYRSADPELAAERLRELRERLGPIAQAQGVELLAGRKVLEMRAQGVNKGAVARRVLAASSAGAVALALGDDRTDEDLFTALPPEAISVHVGRGVSSAMFRVPDVAAARALLAQLLA